MYVKYVIKYKCILHDYLSMLIDPHVLNVKYKIDSTHMRCIFFFFNGLLI